MTIGIDDPGDLTAYLPPTGGHAWIRRGDGMVGIGEIARFEGGTAAEADEWWQEACGRIEQETELPEVSGTGPIAFASFAFDPGHSSMASIVIVPRVVIGRRNGQSWLTVIGATNVPLPGMPDQADRPAEPRAVTEVGTSLGRGPCLASMNIGCTACGAGSAEWSAARRCRRACKVGDSAPVWRRRRRRLREAGGCRTGRSRT